MSTSLLSMLSFRFLLIGGACAKHHYLKIPSARRRRLEVPLIPGLNLELVLEFEAHRLRRIVAFAEHSSAMYFTNVTRYLSMCLRFEAGSNFFLWPSGRPHHPVSMQTLYSVRGFRQPRRAPLSEMWRYVRVEQTAQASGCQVSPSEYDASFLDWARAY
jgi:hypothetical protein